MSEKLLELVMIVKNSGEVLRNCLNSIKPYIDHWTILDTGSVDNTPDIIREEMKGIDGNLYFEDFVDFSTTRNRSLELSSKTCKYTIILDDSYELFGGGQLRNFLLQTDKDAFCIKIGQFNGNVLENYYFSLRIIKSCLNLRYKGRVHEVIDYNNFYYIENDGVFINDIEDFEHVVRSRNRNRKDIINLLQDYEENSKNPRTLYYLAKTYYLLRDYENSVKYYIELDSLDNIYNIDREYKFCAKYELACLEFSEVDNDVEKFNKKLLQIQKLFPERIEPLYRICCILYENKKYEECAKIIEKIMKVPIPKVYITILDTTVYNYYIPYIFIDVNLKLKNVNKVVPKLREMLEKYPYDQPLLNMKYSICDNSHIFSEKLSNNKTLVIHTGSFVKPWDPSKETKISGSEYMAMNMAKEFKNLGYRVFIFGYFEEEKQNIDYQGIYDGIQYIDFKSFEEFSVKYVIDYLIVSRFTSNLVYYDNIKNVYLWVHDILPIINKNAPLFQVHLEKFKGVIVLSEWHKKYVKQKTGIPEHITILSRNAIYTERFSQNIQNTQNIEKIPYRFIYMSDAGRGLSHLIDMLPVIKDRYPETTLVIFTKIEHIDDILLKRIKELDYVSLNPRTTQENISKELLKSDIWLYPTDFTETYCISALEAMAAGCLVATVKLAGLADTVGNRGIMCNEPITEQKNKDELLKKLFLVLDNPAIKQRYIENAKEWAFKQTYQNLAKEWIKIFKSRE
jgi:tetratricopeptide (TPR) repeat protein